MGDVPAGTDREFVWLEHVTHGTGPAGMNCDLAEAFA
jgi:hypothetical protein